MLESVVWLHDLRFDPEVAKGFVAYLWLSLHHRMLLWWPHPVPQLSWQSCVAIMSVRGSVLASLLEELARIVLHSQVLEGKAACSHGLILMAWLVHSQASLSRVAMGFDAGGLWKLVHCLDLCRSWWPCRYVLAVGRGKGLLWEYCLMMNARHIEQELQICKYYW